MNRRARSTSCHFSKQQSPRRNAVHIPVTISGRIKSSSLATSRIVLISSGVNGFRNTVSPAFVINPANGFSAPSGSSSRHADRSNISIPFQVLAAMPRPASASMNARPMLRVTSVSSTHFGYCARINDTNRPRITFDCPM